MKYKVQTLVIDSFGNVDIPEGWIPLGCKEILVTTCGEGTGIVTYRQQELIVLKPVG